MRKSPVVPGAKGKKGANQTASVHKPGKVKKAKVKLSKSFTVKTKVKYVKRRSLPADLETHNTPERKRRKNQIENLQSSLSPEYIGFGEVNGKRSRYGRAQKLKEDDDFLPTQIACYVRRTPSKVKYTSPLRKAQVTPPTPYQSPIEKLIQKNKMLAENNNGRSSVNSQVSDGSSFRSEADGEVTEAMVLGELDLVTAAAITPIIIPSTLTITASTPTTAASTPTTAASTPTITANTPTTRVSMDPSDPRPFDDVAIDDATEFSVPSLKSPSSHSTDSAKGSSIDLEIDFPVKSGELFWARISPFPYWPCMVWPDPQGRTLVLNNNKVQRHSFKIHVRFFGDNGRHSWVHKANMLPYAGREDFDRRASEFMRKHGKKHSIARAFDVNTKKKFTWEKAVAEADEVSPFPLEVRQDMFEGVLERTREMMAMERLRRRQSLGANMSANQLLLPPDVKIKRERSPDVDSGNHEERYDLKVKRIKVDLDSSFVSEETVSNGVDQSFDIEQLYQDEEFELFHDIIKKYAFKKTNPILEKQLEMSVRRIWYLRHLAKVNDDDGRSMSIRKLHLQVKGLDKTPTSSPTGTSKALPPSHRQSMSVERSKAEKKPPPKPMEEVVQDILELSKNYLFKGLSKEPVCKDCHLPSNLVKCSGNCQSLVHKDCSSSSRTLHITGDLDELKPNIENETDNALPMCSDCHLGESPKCFVCKQNDSELGELVRCHVNWCSQTFHIKCLKYWPQSKVTKSSAKVESLLCPAHVCHTCVSDDPRGKFFQIEKAKLIRCIECPATYHSDSFCIPAGTKFLTATQIVCPRHGKHEKLSLNANWCFICATGGRLICCDTCPTAFHLECLNIPQPDGNYICEECETGRLPLYGEMVWAKLGSYRWWPSIIIPPTDVPKNLQSKKHEWSEFCIRFFGTNDHTWINRNRVFLYQEGDWGKVTNTKGINQSYKQGLEEARKISELLKKQKQLKGPRKDKGLAPLPYTKIKFNRPVPPVRLQETDISELTPCECSPADEDPCGPYSGCLNRLLMTECNPKVCPAGAKCQNQLFEKRLYPPLKIHSTDGRGWGLICEKEVRSGTFIIEYVGEVIDDNEFQRRIVQKEEEKDENYYFLTLEKYYIIDAGPKGNLARFMNHSCEPNCETQKWTVNGITRIGLFALVDIPANTELTFNYNWECLGNNKKICHCGAEKCSGLIGEKYREAEKDKSASKPTLSAKAKSKTKSSKKRSISNAEK